MTLNDRAIVPQRISLVVLAVYWAALFVATHSPYLPKEILRHSDKRLHFAAFAVLATLFAWTWSLRATFTWRQCLAILAILALYAALDEITQPLVGRTRHLADWVADMLGAVCGLIAFTAAVRFFHRRA